VSANFDFRFEVVWDPVGSSGELRKGEERKKNGKRK